MKKVTSKQIFMSVLVVAFALCALVYVMVYTKYNDMTDALKKSNKTLSDQVVELEGYYINMQDYRDKTAEMATRVNVLTEDYASEANEEDFIMTAVDMQSAAIINYEKISIDTEEVIHTIPADVATGSKIKDLESEILFYERKASFANVTDYANLKACVEVIYNNDYKVGIDALTYKREGETNNFIKGTIDITYYSLQGMNKEYKYPKMDTYLSGVQNNDLFGKMVVTEEE